jgi:NAD(P)-dependent dehydrogenase (short-subunit alcohol dehydrogenase family)
MNLPFETKVALVTGAGSGMGLATAKAFAEKGAAVALVDTNENAIQSAAEKFLADGHRAMAIRCNVVDEAQVAAMVKQTVSTLAAWMRPITMPACSLLRLRPLTPAVRSSTV